MSQMCYVLAAITERDIMSIMSNIDFKFWNWLIWAQYERDTQYECGMSAIWPMQYELSMSMVWARRA